MSGQNKWLRAAAWLIAGPFGGVLLFYLLVLGVNWRDKPPSKTAQKLQELYASVERVPDAQNAFVYGMGFSARRYDDPQVIGLRRITWIKRQIENPKSTSRGDPVADGIDYKSGRSEAVEALAQKCQSFTTDCELALAQVGAEATAEDWVTSEQWLLDRYRALLERRWWVATFPSTLSSPLPPFSTIMEGQRLLLARVWSIAGTGETSAVQHLLNEDLRFWRRMLETSDNLITKMIAVAGLHRHFAWSSAALRRLPANAVMSALPPDWKRPLSDHERQMWFPLAGEWVFQDRLIRDLRKEARSTAALDSPGGLEWVDRVLWRATAPLLQPQDYSNAVAEYLAGIAQLARAPLDQYPKTLERMHNYSSILSENRVPFSRMYNVTGDWYFWSGNAEYGPYAARVADVEGVRRMAVLIADLQSRGIAAADVPKALAESTLRSPYTNEPFAWDAKANAVVFTGLEKSERGRRAFKY